MSDFHYVRTMGPEGGVDAAEGAAVGIDLASMLDAGLPPVRVAVQILAGLAEILAIAEEDKVVHGDLDLEHVFLDDTGAVSLEGFGQGKTTAPEGRPLGAVTDRFGLGAVGFALFSPRDLPELPKKETGYDDAVIDAVLGLNLEGVPEDLIGDIQWYLTRLLGFTPDERPTALEVWRTFGAMADLVDGPEFAAWCNDAVDGGGQRRDRDQASRPMARPLKGELHETSVTGGPMPKGALNFEDNVVDKGRSTAFWTRQGMKDALAKAISSDYMEPDANSDWMPGTPIPTMDRQTSPGGQRWSGPAPVPRRAPGEGRQRAERRAAPSPMPAPPRAGKAPGRTPVPPVQRTAPVPVEAPPARKEPAPAPLSPEPSWAAFPDVKDGLDDDKTEVGKLGVPTRSMTPKPSPMRTFEPTAGQPPQRSAAPRPPMPGDSPTVPDPAMASAPVRPSSASNRPRRGPSAPTPQPVDDPDAEAAYRASHTGPVLDAYVPDATDGGNLAEMRDALAREFPDAKIVRRTAPTAPIREDAPTRQPADLHGISPVQEQAPAPSARAATPAPSERAAPAPRHQGPIPEVDLSRQHDPFAEEEPQGPSMLLLGGIGAAVMVAVVFCVGVGGIGGAAAIFGATGSTASTSAPRPAPTARAPRQRPDPDKPRDRVGVRPAPRTDPTAAPSPAPDRQVAEASPAPVPVPVPLPVPAPGAVPGPRAVPGPAPVSRPLPQPAPTPLPNPASRPVPSPAPFPRPSTAFTAPTEDERPDPLAGLLGSSPMPAPLPAPVGPRPLPLGPLVDNGGSILPFLVPEPAPNPDGTGPNAMQVHMRQHLTAATAARDAVVAGDPERARQAAQGLEFINPPDALPPSWLPYVVDLRMEAWLMGNSPDIAAAGFKVAQIGQSCATCHEGVRAGPTVTPAAVPPRSFEERDVMKRHAWAADWMWVGLISNDQASWTKGATVLRDSPFPSVIFADFPEQQFMDLENKLHELATEGQTSTRPEQRALVYGKLLATCSRCHAAYRKAVP